MDESDPPALYRPGPLCWFWYAAGGRLPDRYRAWVLHDLTCRTWPLRHLARLVAQFAPVAIVLVLLLIGEDVGGQVGQYDLAGDVAQPQLDL